MGDQLKKLLLLLLASASPAFAQSVQQSGNVTPGHAACWAITGAIYDCGSPGGGVSVVGSTTTNDFVAFNASGSLIDSGINPANTSAISGLWNFNGGATAPTRPVGDSSTNVATTAFVGNFLNTIPYIIAPPAPITEAASDILLGVLQVDKTLAFAMPGGASTGIFAAIYANNIIGEGTWSNQVGIIGNVLNSNTQHSQPGSTASAVGTYGVGACEVVACSATWGMVAAAYDLSGQTASVNPLIGLEVDNYANGSGGNGNRIGVLIVSSTPTQAGVANAVDSGILFAGTGTPGAGNGVFINLINGGTAHTMHGVDLGAMTITGDAWISPGATIDNIGNALFRVVTVNNGINVNGQAVDGGALANSTLFLVSTANGSPSGDSVELRGSTTNIKDAAGVTTFASFASAGATVAHLYGGVDAASILSLTSTSNGSPSGDAIALQTSQINMENAIGTVTYVSFKPTLVQFGGNVPAHISTQQPTPPALTSCGSTPAITGTDTAGIVTMGTGAPTSCTITFNVAYSAAPYCTVTWIATPLTSQSYVTSASTIVLTQTGTSSNKVQYICIAQSGG